MTLPQQGSYIGDELDPGSSSSITQQYTGGVTTTAHTDQQGVVTAELLTGQGHNRTATTGIPQAPVLVHRNPGALHHNLPTRGLDVRQARKV
jgi:hypothetical protein